jgi:hypothetical protein
VFANFLRHRHRQQNELKQLQQVQQQRRTPNLTPSSKKKPLHLMLIKMRKPRTRVMRKVTLLTKVLLMLQVAL